MRHPNLESRAAKSETETLAPNPIGFDLRDEGLRSGTAGFEIRMEGFRYRNERRQAAVKKNDPPANPT